MSIHIAEVAPKNFKPLLSATLESDDDLRRLGGWPYIVSPKLDGIRTLMLPNVTKTGHPCATPVARKIKALPNAYVRTALEIASTDLLPLIGCDGELVAGPPQDLTHPEVFQRTTSAVMSHGGSPEVTYWIFDTFTESKRNLPFEARYEYLEKTLPGILINLRNIPPGINFAVLPHRLVNNVEELLGTETEYLQQGFEGIMVRHREGKYKFGRSTLRQQDLLKLKRFTDGEAEIIALEELMINNNPQTIDNLGHAERSSHKENLVGAGMLGSFRVQAINGPFKGVVFNIGSGFDDSFRSMVWNNKDKFLRSTLTYKYQKTGSKLAPRFPIFRGMRAKDDI